MKKRLSILISRICKRKAKKKAHYDKVISIPPGFKVLINKQEPVIIWGNKTALRKSICDVSDFRDWFNIDINQPNPSSIPYGYYSLVYPNRLYQKMFGNIIKAPVKTIPNDLFETVNDNIYWLNDNEWIDLNTLEPIETYGLNHNQYYTDFSKCFTSSPKIENKYFKTPNNNIITYMYGCYGKLSEKERYILESKIANHLGENIKSPNPKNQI